MHKFILRMKEMTAQSDKDLCPSCSHVFERKDSKGTVRGCGLAPAKAELVHGRVVECTGYYPKNLPSLHNMSQIAWEITTTERKGKMGFSVITPTDRRKRGLSDADVDLD